ncbi:MAG: type II toxin-antitoxin system HipA family toxin [Bacteroidales bacterium]|nr:type II toxin-antitoxin system HipA family toxin [Bacteroidales bacterium]
MMKIWVYADFDWLKEAELIGELSFDNLRGSEIYSFQYSKDWLKKHSDIFLSDDINNYQGMQYTQPGKDIFGCFSDALPDRWGRLLLNRREQIFAREEKRPSRKLTSFDYLIGIDDFSRMGGLRFKIKPTGNFINNHFSLKIPALTSLRNLMQASLEIEHSEDKNELPEMKWIIQLVQPGSSLGGARPKSSIIDEHKNLNIAKFPSFKDEYDIGLWEHFSHLLAGKAGIKVSSTRLIAGLEKYHTLLSKRFDRTKEGKRIHFASAMTMLGLSDGDNYANGYGYLDLVDFIVKACTNVENNLMELYRRVAFNICIGNTDDHFRNHGFLLTAKGWTLSPAFDINPSLNNYQSLLVSASSNESDLNLLLDSGEEYMLEKRVCKEIIQEVLSAVKEWKKIAKQVKISTSEMNRFSSRIEKHIP